MRTTGLIQFFSKGRLGLFDLGGKGDRGREGKDQNEEPFLKLVTPLPSSFSPPLLLLFSLWGKCKCVTCLCPGGTVGIIPRGEDAAAPLLRNYEDARSWLPTKIHGEKVCIFLTIL